MHSSNLNFLNNYNYGHSEVIQSSISNEEIKLLYNSYLHISKYIKDNDLTFLEEGLNIMKSVVFKFIFSLATYKEIYNSITDEEFEFLNNFINDLSIENEEIEEDWKNIVRLINEFKNNLELSESRKEVEELLDKKQNEKLVIISILDQKEFFDNFEDIDFLTPNQLLKSRKIYDLLIFIGNPYLYKQFDNLFLGKKIYYIFFDFFQHKKFSNKIFKKNLNKNSEILKNTKFIYNINPNKYLTSIKESEITKVEYMNKNIKINREIYKKTSIKPKENSVIGYPLIFKNNKYYIVPENNDLHILTQYSNDNDKIKLKLEKRKVKQLASDDYILIKGNTETKFIKKKAAEILGNNKYEFYKYLLKEFKKDLKKTCKNFISKRLFFEDLKRNGINVNNNKYNYWISDDSIRPTTLKELLKYLKYEEKKINKIMLASSSINSSHIKAGKIFLNTIEEIINDNDVEVILEKLKHCNELIFLENGIGEFYIEVLRDVNREKRKYDLNYINKLYDVEGD